MRIVAGKWKGRPLVHFKADHIRPTTDRVKEVLFNMIRDQIAEAKVLDLFSGTGSLTFESLSRGAASVVAVEKSKKSIGIMRRNMDLFDCSDSVSIVQKDVLTFLKKTPLEPFDVIFIDPPFTEKMADQVMEGVAGVDLLMDGGVAYIESTKHEVLKGQYGDLVQTRQKSFGDKFLTCFEKNAETPAEG